jgi:hypothetical protein
MVLVRTLRPWWVRRCFAQPVWPILSLPIRSPSATTVLSIAIRVQPVLVVQVDPVW